MFYTLDGKWKREAAQSMKSVRVDSYWTLANSLNSGLREQIVKLANKQVT